MSKKLNMKNREQEASKGADVLAIKKRAADDFFFYAALFFPHYVTSPFAEFHREAHKVTMSPRAKKAIILPRGHGKSTYQMLNMSWHILTKKNHYFIAIGNSIGKSKQNYILPLMTEFETNNLIKAVYGDVRGSIWGMDGLEFEFKDKDGKTIDRKEVKPFGVGQSIRGTRYLQYRPDYIVADDIEDDEQVRNSGRREEIRKYFFEQVYPALDRQGDIYSDTIFGGDPKMIITGTILHYDSFLINLASKQFRGIWDVVKHGCIEEDEKGGRKSLWGTRYSLEYWDKLREQYKLEGRERSFRQEYLNEIMSDDDREIPVDKLKYFVDSDIENKTLIKYVSVDIALSSSEQAMADNHRDYNAIVTIGCEKATGNVYVLDIIRFKTADIMKTITEALYSAIKWLPRFVIYERASMQTMFETLFRNEMNRLGNHFILKPISHGSRRKEDRIKLSVKTVVEQGKLFLKKDFDETNLLYDEIYEFPLGKHDDIIDALSYAIFGSEQRFNYNEIEERKNAIKEKFDDVWQGIKNIIKKQDEEDVEPKYLSGSHYNY